MDCIRGKYNCVFFVSEIYPKTLFGEIENFFRSAEDQLQITFDIFCATEFLHSKRIFHRCWHPNFLYVIRRNSIEFVNTVFII